MLLQLYLIKFIRQSGLSFLVALIGIGSVSALGFQEPEAPASLPETGLSSQDRETDRKDAYYHFSKGMIHHHDEEFEKAVSEFELALQADPGNPYLMSRFAATLAKAGYITRAVEMRRKAVEIKPRDPDLRYLFSNIYFNYRAQENMRIKAEEQLKKTLEIDPTHNRALMDLGQIYWESGEWEKVIEVFSQLRQLDPTIVRAYLAEAQALENLGKVSEAADVLIAGLQYGRGIPDYMILLGNYLEQLERNQRAVEVYLEGLEKSSEPHATQFKQKLAFLYNRMEEFEKALPFLQELNEKYPQVALVKIELARSLRNTGKHEEALEVLEKAIILAPDNVQANYELSSLLILTGNHLRAIEILEHLVDVDQAEGGEFREHFLTRLGLLYRDEGLYEKSIEAFQKVLAENQDDIDSWLRLLTTYREAEMNGKADELSIQLLEEYPDDPFVIIGRGQTLVARGRVDEGIRFLKSEARSCGDQEARDTIYMVLGQMLIDEGRFEEAHRVMDEALALNAESQRLKFLKASVYERDGRIKEAEKLFKELLKDSPEDASVMNYLGYMLVENDLKFEEAGELLEKAVRLEPYNGAYLDSLGWLYFKLGHYDKAERHLLKASRIQKNDPVILEHLGDLYAKTGDVEAAGEYYRRSIGLAETKEASERVQQKLLEILQR